MKKRLVRKIFDMCQEIADREDKEVSIKECHCESAILQFIIKVMREDEMKLIVLVW